MLEAQNILVQLRVVDFPNMKPNDRKKFHRDIYKKAFPKMFQEKKVIHNLKDLEGLING